MADLNESTTISMKLWQFITGGVAIVVALLVGLWVVWDRTTGTMQDDVGAIRARVETLTTAGVESTVKASTTETGLRTELAELTAQLKITTDTLAKLSDSVTGLDGSIKLVDQKLSASVIRQEQFERWVVVTLGRSSLSPDFKPPEIPIGWQKEQSAVLDAIVAKDSMNPLTGWFSSSGQQK